MTRGAMMAEWYAEAVYRRGSGLGQFVYVWAWRRDPLAARQHPVQAVGRRLRGRVVATEGPFTCLEVPKLEFLNWCYKHYDMDHPRIVAVGAARDPRPRSQP
jgi:hypothetical protein